MFDKIVPLQVPAAAFAGAVEATTDADKTMIR